MSEPGAGTAGDGITGGPRTPQQVAASRRLQQTQAQVDEVVGIMRMNVEKVLERDQRLSELDDRSNALQQGASQFEQQAGKLKRKYWWKNLKMMIIMGVIALLLIIIISVWLSGGGDDSSSSSSGGGASTAAPTAGALTGEKGMDTMDSANASSNGR